MVDSLWDDIVIANTAQYQDPRDAVRLLNTAKSADAWDQKWVWEERLRSFLGPEGGQADFSSLTLKDLKKACVSLVEPEKSINFLAPVSVTSTHNPHEAIWNTIVEDDKMYWSSEPGPKDQEQKLVYCARRSGTAFRKVTVIPYSHYYRRYRGDIDDQGGLKTFGWESLNISFYRGGELPVDVNADEVEDILLGKTDCEKVFSITWNPEEELRRRRRRKREAAHMRSCSLRSSLLSSGSSSSSSSSSSTIGPATTNTPPDNYSPNTPGFFRNIRARIANMPNVLGGGGGGGGGQQNAEMLAIRHLAEEFKVPATNNNPGEGEGTEGTTDDDREEEKYEVDLGQFVCADWMIITLNNRLKEEYTNLGWYFCVKKVLVEGSVLFKDIEDWPVRHDKEAGGKVVLEKQVGGGGDGPDYNRIQWWATQPDFMRRRTNLPFDRFVYHNWLRLMRSDLLYFPLRR